MAFQRGEVVLVPFPFSNLTVVKVRPAIIVSSALYQTTEPDLILAAITSNLHQATGPLDYILVDWQKAGLLRPSAFKPVLFTLDPARIVHHLGVVTNLDLGHIHQKLQLILGL